MSIFDGMLLATDWDGTVARGNVINDEDAAAIKYFQENGGTYTVCSGRAPSYFNNFLDKIRPNTYVIGLNGALIEDIYTGERLYEGFIGEDGVRVARDILSKDLPCKDIYYSVSGKENFVYISKEDFFTSYSELLKADIHKIVNVYNNGYDAEKILNELKLKDISPIICVRSWDTGLEILNGHSAKGEALKRVARAIGARLTVAAGDHENDLQLIEYADIGYAVGNAKDCLKAVADRITKPISECAIAAIIEDLKQNIG